MGHFHADMDPAILNQRDVAVWFTFRAEASARPEFRPYIDSHETQFHGNLIEICAALKEEGNYQDLYPDLAANCFVALLEGIWTDFHLHGDAFDYKNARDSYLFMARRFFPDHFPLG